MRWDLFKDEIADLFFYAEAHEIIMLQVDILTAETKYWIPDGL